MMQHLLDVLEQVDVVPHDDEIAQIATWRAAHVAVFVAHQLAGSVGVRLDVFLHQRHLQRAKYLIVKR